MKERTLRVGNLVVDRDEYVVKVGGRAVELTRAEFELLAALVDSRGKVLSPRELAEQVFGPGTDAASRRLAVHISRLRKKIAGSRPWGIRTVVKRGYALSDMASRINTRTDQAPKGGRK